MAKHTAGQAFLEADVDGDGKLQFGEFRRWFMGTKTMGSRRRESGSGIGNKLTAAGNGDGPKASAAAAGIDAAAAAGGGGAGDAGGAGGAGSRDADSVEIYTAAATTVETDGGSSKEITHSLRSSPLDSSGEIVSIKQEISEMQQILAEVRLNTTARSEGVERILAICRKPINHTANADSTRENKNSDFATESRSACPSLKIRPSPPSPSSLCTVSVMLERVRQMTEDAKRLRQDIATCGNLIGSISSNSKIL